MLKNILSLLLLSTLFLSGAAIELNYEDKKFENFTLLYIIDTNNSYTAQTVQDATLKTISNKHGFNAHTGSTWYKLSLKNTTSISKEFYIHNDFAYFSKEILIFEFSQNRLIDQNRYDILEKGSENPLTGASLIYRVSIAPNTTKTIIIKNTPMVSSLFNLNLYDKKSSLEALIDYSVLPIFIIAIMLTLAFYNATLYMFNKRREFILYALYMVTPALGLLYKYGIIFSYFHLYGEMTYWLNLTAIVMPAFLILFLKEVLKTEEMDKKINYLLNAILLITAINITLALLIDLSFAMEVFKLMFIFTTFILIYLGIYLFKSQHPLAKIFAWAYGFYLTGLIVTILAMSGILAMNSFTFMSGGLGIIVEGFLFSYLMHNNINILEKKLKIQRETIVSKNRKEQLGEMISAITHQWKQPLSRITSITSLLTFKISQDTKIAHSELSGKITLIEKDINFLSETINDFKDFFHSSTKIENCNVALVVENAIKMSQGNSLQDGLMISSDLHFDAKIDISKNELLHIILNILQNAKEAFKSSEETIKIIKVMGYNKDNKLYIDIIDNAGGINEDKLPLIFNENYTTKENKTGSGLGLYISKIIMDEHLKGKIEVSNIQGGTMFRIIL